MTTAVLRPRPAAAAPSHRAVTQRSLPVRALSERTVSLRTPAMLLGALVVGVACASKPSLTVLGCIAAIAVAFVACRPQWGAYLVIGLTPLTAGIDRGLAIPVLRPSEALAVLVGCGLVARALVRRRTGQSATARLSPIERSLVLMAFCASAVPLVWMLARGTPITKDDVLYAFVLWKFSGIYLIVRVSITTAAQALRCLYVSIVAAFLVGAIAVLQSLELFGVPALLAAYYAPFGYTDSLSIARGSSTLSLSAATADLMIYNLAIVCGLLLARIGPRLLLGGAAAVCVLGTLAAGEFSSAIGLVIAVCCIVAVTGSTRLLAMFVPGALIAGVLLEPVIATRLDGFDSVSGLPVSWIGRLDNLRGYFWPKLFSDWNYLLGVGPSARIHNSYQATGYIWIESGYTWLLWGGGIPLLLAFVYFVRVAMRTGWAVARTGTGAPAIAGQAVVTSVVVMCVLMLFDPHLTYRGAAEEMFTLLALMTVGRRTGNAVEKQMVEAFR